MKIAIFGDSFADDRINWKDKWQDVGPSWVDYLRQYHNIDNFSLGGSCLYYSKKKFDSVDLNLYDKIIFMVTESARRYQVIKEDSPDEHKNWNWTSSMARAGQFPNDKKYLETIHNFFVYMHNESDEYFRRLMIEDIRRKKSNTLIIDYDDIWKISLKEINYWKKRGYELKKYEDARKCHMTEENNLIFGKLIQDSIEKIEVVINVDHFVDPIKNFEHYFR